MATQAEAQVIRSATQSITDLVTRDLGAFWGSLDLSKPEAVRDALLEYTPLLTAQYGDIAATVSADWYDELRLSSGATGSFSAVLADTVSDDVIASQVRFGSSHLFTDNPTGTLDFLTDAVTKYALQPGRDTIATSAWRDPSSSGWHRQARPDGCGFCQMLQGRGGVYKEATAHFSAHGHCHCIAVPSWDAKAPEVDRSVYDASRVAPKPKPESKTSAFDSMSREQVLSQIKTLEGLKDSDYRTKQLARLQARLAQLT